MSSEHDRELGSISAQLLQILASLDRIENRTNDIEVRTRENEQWRSRLIGMAMALSLLVSLATSWVQTNVTFTAAVAQQPTSVIKPEEVTQ